MVSQCPFGAFGAKSEAETCAVDPALAIAALALRAAAESLLTD